MERREFIALLGVAAAMMPSSAHAEMQHLAEPGGAKRGNDKLSGTWSFASSVNTRKDGSTFERWGENPKGIFMFDRGHYAQIIIGGESRVFGAKVYCAFGTYTLDETTKSLVTHIQACSVSKAVGTTQSRAVVILTADEFKYSNPSTSSGSLAEVLWKRVA
jgi:hypothetical protein